MLTMPMLLAGTMPNYLVSDLGIPTSANSNDTSGPQASLFLNFRTDGTWDFTVDPSGDVLTATPSSGTWLVTSGANPANYEIKYTVTAGPTTATVNNDAATFTTLSATRSIEIMLAGTPPDTDSITVTVDVREILNTANTVQDTGIVMSITFT